ncbi:MAG: NAD-dependent epimerase/dehydratase family protein [Candidatus Omnitrophica bacterium]|nr:NAD-dependent epimerase/dehydratase family protein [Candidatus Omnitrophota bacterium]
MKVLITGGSGFLGINLIRYLLDKGINDIVSLDIADFDYPERTRIKVVKGDIRDQRLVSELTQGVDQVIHSAAALPLYSKKEIFSVDVEGTRNMIENSYQNKVKRFIHISSTAVYGVPDHHPIYEDDRIQGVGYYGEAKIMAEEQCFQYRKQGMCVPVLRPKSYVGPERLGVFAMLYDWAKDRRNFPMIGSGNNRYQLLDVEDLCEAVYICMTCSEDKANQTYNIGAKEFTTMKEDFQAVLDEAGFGKKIVPFPAWPVIIALKTLEFFKLSPLYKWVYETACKDSFVSVEKAEKILGFTPKYSNKQALIRNYRWYMDNLHSFEGKTGISHRVPWNQGILGLIKKFF